MADVQADRIREFAVNQESLIQPVVTRLSRHTRFSHVELQALHELPGRVVQVPLRTDFVHLGEETLEATFIVN